MRAMKKKNNRLNLYKSVNRKKKIKNQSLNLLLSRPHIHLFEIRL